MQKTLLPLDGVRGLAILLVLWVHWDMVLVQVGWLPEPYWLHVVASFGFSGVLLFFVLSGFLLFLPYARSLLAGTAWPSPRQFYVRRFRRIYPLYLIVLGILVINAIRLGILRASLGSFALAVPLLFDLRSDSFTRVTSLNPPLWSLAVEWQFYLVLPWLALALAKLVQLASGHALAVRLALGLGLLVVSGLLIRAVAAISFYSGWAAFPGDTPGPMGTILSFLFGIHGKELEIFALGMGGSLLYVWAVEMGHLSVALQRVFSRIILPLVLLGLGGCCWWAFVAGHIPTLAIPFPVQSPGWAVLGEWLVSFCFVLLLLSVLFGHWAAKVFSFAPLRFIGKISYSLYLWHWLLLGLLVYGIGPALLALFLLCSVSYYVIERPFLRYRRV